MFVYWKEKRAANNNGFKERRPSCSSHISVSRQVRVQWRP